MPILVIRTLAGGYPVPCSRQRKWGAGQPPGFGGSCTPPSDRYTHHGSHFPRVCGAAAGLPQPTAPMLWDVHPALLLIPAPGLGILVLPECRDPGGFEPAPRGCAQPKCPIESPSSGGGRVPGLQRRSLLRAASLRLYRGPLRPLRPRSSRPFLSSPPGSSATTNAPKRPLRVTS